MSTLETCAHALKYTEQENTEIYDIIVRPLKYMVALQLQWGACHHHNRLSLIQNGKYKRKCGKKTVQKIDGTSTLNNNITIIPEN